MIYFQNVCKIYPPNNYVCLDDINLTVSQGEFVSIVGHSGAGKTTLVKMILAEDKPSSGTVFFNSEDIHLMKNRELTRLRQKIGVVFQDFKLLPQKTVYENVAFALEVSGYPKKYINEIVPQILMLVNLSDKSHNFPDQLSGGQQQRVSIARALAHRPKILIADEPTGNLDSINTREIIDLLLKINEYKTTVLLVTHNREVVNSLRKRVIAMEDGRIASDKARGRYVF